MRITLRGHPITLRDAFGEGHILTAPEAAALNARRADLIRNRLNLRFQNRVLDADAILELERAAKVEDENFTFDFVRGPRPLGYERELRRFAEELGGDEGESKIRELMLDEEVKRVAFERAQAKAAIAKAALAELIGGL